MSDVELRGGACGFGFVARTFYDPAARRVRVRIDGEARDAFCGSYDAANRETFRLSVIATAVEDALVEIDERFPREPEGEQEVTT